jgi:hypothetical protein
LKDNIWSNKNTFNIIIKFLTIKETFIAAHITIIVLVILLCIIFP